MNAVAHYSYLAALASMCAPVQKSLTHELIDALQHDPQREVSTPGFKRGHNTAAYVVGDMFAGSNGDALLHDVLKIVGGCALGQDMRLAAMALIARVAKEHAEFHAEDAIAAIEA